MGFGGLRRGGVVCEVCRWYGLWVFHMPLSNQIDELSDLI